MHLLIFRHSAERTCKVDKATPTSWAYHTLEEADLMGQRQLKANGNLYDGYLTMELEHFIGIMIEKIGKDLFNIEGRYGSKCEERAKSQPHFILLAQDLLATECIELWITKAKEHGAPEDKLARAKKYISDILAWRTKNPNKCKYPD